MNDLFDTISKWLLEQALSDSSISETFEGLTARLIEGGIPIVRMSMGRGVLHPTIGAINMEWSAVKDHVSVDSVPKALITRDYFTSTPFGDLGAGIVDRVIANLRDPKDLERYQIFRELADDGICGYVAFSRRFGRSAATKVEMRTVSRGAAVSFATRRFLGFTDEEIEGLNRLVTPLCICTRVHNDRFLTEQILETYLGRISGEQVLDGNISLGDGQSIECAIFYSDLRGSVELSQQLDVQTYLDTLNDYFSCTAKAVSEHGGEVLKFIGDGVLAIFPFDSKTRLRTNMCAAALHSAREAIARAEHINLQRIEGGLPELKFGIALHVGEVIYGNVGIENRLDFTATGQAVGLAARIEQLTRQLNASILATEEFSKCCSEDHTPQPEQLLRGFNAPVKIVQYQPK